MTPERHYTTTQLAAMLGRSSDTIIRRFKGKPGVIDMGTPKRALLSIPASLVFGEKNGASSGGALEVQRSRCGIE